MARPVWSGAISFGLVNVPVKAYPAVRDHDVHFHQIDRRTGARIRNRKVSAETGKEVDADDIEMGFEIEDGRYVTFEKGELDELRPASTRSIDVTDFVALDDVDPIYYERTYWLAPDGEAGKRAYQLLRAAMEDRERVAIGTVVMRNKQYLTAIRPLDGALAMSTMRFADEVVPRSDVDEVPDRRAKPEPKMLRMATELVDSLAGDWDPGQYNDTYTEELRERIAAKEAGEEITAEPTPEAEGKVVDLMEALQASVEGSRKRGGRGGGRRRTSRPRSRSGSSKSKSTSSGKSRSRSKAG
jgi:DNA end-binding protein Ku